MKILYLNGYKWLLFQNQQVRNDFLVIDGTRNWQSISNFFLKKDKSERTSVPGLFLSIILDVPGSANSQDNFAVEGNLYRNTKIARENFS